MFRRALTVLLVVALAATGCSSDDADTPSTAAPARDAPDVTILPPADPNGPGNGAPDDQDVPENTDDGRLVVQHADHQLSTMLPDGSESEPLTDPGRVNSQASWAPDGSRIAWVSTDPATGESAIYLDRYDRSDFREVPVDARPFYLYWDPSSSRIAHFAGADTGIDLSVAEPFVNDGPINRRIDRGQPYFMSWGPDGDELLVHASGFRLDRIDLGDSTVIIDEFPAAFGAPAWLADNSLVYADIENDAQYLISTGASGEGRRPLVTFDGTLRFAVNNDGNRVVMQAYPTGDNDDGVITASTTIPAFPPTGTAHDAETQLVNFQSGSRAQPTPEPTPDPIPDPTPDFDDSLDAIDPIEPFIPYVMGTFGGEPHPLSNVPAVAIFPSPDGEAIAWFEVAGQDLWVLRVDFDGTIYTSPGFAPSEILANEYLNFFDQYEQSHDFWSPSSNLFVFAGTPLGDAEPGILIFDRSTGDIDRISDGVVASFTRTPSAAGAASAL